MNRMTGSVTELRELSWHGDKLQRASDYMPCTVRITRVVHTAAVAHWGDKYIG